MTFLLIGGKQLWFLFQSLVRIPRILPIIALLLWQVASVKPWNEWSTVDLSGILNLTNVQCGFRSKRSTVDHLVRFETFCREAFIHNQHLVSVFFDLEKDYDTTWKYGIMKDPFIYLEERSSTSVWALSVYSDSSPHFGRMQSFCSRKERYIW